MPKIQTVVSTDTFLTWRTRTNDLINVFNMPTVGNVQTLSTRVETFDITESAGVHIGCTITEVSAANGNISVSAGEALLRTTALPSAQLVSVELPVTALTLPAGATSFIYADYNGGSPLVSSTTNRTIVNGMDVALIGIVDVSLTFGKTILQVSGTSGDFERRINHRMQAVEGLRKASGADIAEGAGRTIQISSGEFYYGTTEVLSSAIDTSAGGQFEYYWKDSTGTWIETLATAFDNANVQTFGVGTGTAPMTAGWFRTDWIYLKIGGNATTCYVVMGENEYASAAEAKNDTPPQTGHFPPALSTLGVLIGRAVIQQGGVSLVSLDSTLNSTNFSTSGDVKFSDAAFRIFDDADPTKQVAISANNITPGVTRVVDVPNKDGTLALLEDINHPFDEVYKISANGNLSQRVVPYSMNVAWGAQESETTISVNGKAVVLDAKEDDKGIIAVQTGDIIESSKPISLKDSIDGNVLSSLNAVGEHFWFPTNRANPHEVFFYAPYYDVTVIYKQNSTNFAVSDNVWDPVLGGETNIITVPAGTVKRVYIMYDPASPAGPVPLAGLPATGRVDHYFHSDGPMVVTKEGNGLDHFVVYPMSREILYPSPVGAAAMTASFDGSIITSVGNGYYISDGLLQAASIADGAGGSGHTGIPYDMCGDSYHIEHDIAGYQILAVDPGEVRVFCNGIKQNEISFATASKSLPQITSVGSGHQGTPAAVSLAPTIGYLVIDVPTGAFVIGETITQAVSGATGTIHDINGNRLNLENVTGTFDLVNSITGGTSGATSIPLETLYRSWTIEGTMPFALRTNDPADDEYIPMGFRRSERPYAYDLTRRVNQDLHVLADEVQERAAFVSNMDPDLDHEWIKETNTLPDNDIDSQTDPTAAGKSFKRVQRTRRYYKELIPFQEDKLYKISAKVRQFSVSGDSAFYLGVKGVQSDQTTLVNQNGLDSLSTQHYVGASGVTLPVGTWTIVTGYFKGHGAFINGQNTHPLNPSGLHTDVRYFSPLILTNWGVNASTASELDIDWIRVDIVEDDQIDQEIIDRTNADVALGARIDQEIADRIAADNALSAADVALGARIDTTDQSIIGEANTRAAADNAIDSRITAVEQSVTAEAGTRAGADTALDNKIAQTNTDLATEVLARTNADTTLSTDLATETQSRIDADALLQTALDTHVASVHQAPLTNQDANRSAVNVAGDWNTHIATGFYRGSGLLNAPAATGAHSWRFVTVVNHNNNWVVQYMTDFNNVASWQRTKLNGTWTAWKLIILNSSVSTANTGDTIVQRTANGYIYGTHLNMSAATQDNFVPDAFCYTSGGDGFVRRMSLNTTKNQILGNIRYVGQSTYRKFNIGGTYNYGVNTTISLTTLRKTFWSDNVITPRDNSAFKAAVDGIFSLRGTIQWYRNTYAGYPIFIVRRVNPVTGVVSELFRADEIYWETGSIDTFGGFSYDVVCEMNAGEYLQFLKVSSGNNAFRDVTATFTYEGIK